MSVVCPVTGVGVGHGAPGGCVMAVERGEVGHREWEDIVALSRVAIDEIVDVLKLKDAEVVGSGVEFSTWSW